MNKSSLLSKSFLLLISKILVVVLGIFVSFFIYTRIKDPAHLSDEFNEDSLIEISTDRSYDRYFVPIMISKLNFDSLIVGSSMVANLLSSKIDEAFSVQSLNASMNGSCLYEQHKLICFASSQKKIKNIFWGIDLNSLGLSYNYIAKEIQYPEYLFSSSKLSKVLYCLDIKTDRFNAKALQKIKVKDFNSWNDPQNVSAENLLNDWQTIDEEKMNSTAIIDAATYKILLTNKQKYAIDRNIVSLIENNKDCTFYLFFPPYSILELRKMMLESKLSLILSCKDYLVERLQNFQNVHIFDFTVDNSITYNLNNYIDFIHYRNCISDLIINMLKVKENNIDYYSLLEMNEKLFMQVKEFNIDIIKSK